MRYIENNRNHPPPVSPASGGQRKAKKINNHEK